jgi:type IV pilus assembly protein PilY1
MNLSLIGHRVRRVPARIGLFLLFATSIPQASSAAIKLADQPLFSTISVPSGNLALALSVEWPTATTPAYPSTTDYDASSTFLGYFDPAKCYLYVAVNSGTTASPDYSTSYFTPDGSAASHACASTSSLPLWSGNYLNWASMQTLDAFRWVLTGGYRSVDSSSATVLTKTYAAMDNSAMPQKKAVPAVLAGATPFTSAMWSSGATTRLRNLGTRMWITGSATGSGSLVAGALTSGAVPYVGQSSAAASTDSNYADPTKTYELYINVKVCDAGVASSGIEANCTPYGGGAAKPEGLMQKYASKLRYSAFGYYNHSGDTSQQRDGGVMRARMNYIGPTQPVPGSADIANSIAEWNATTGIMAINPDASDATATVNFAATAGWSVPINNSGVMNYLNKFGYAAKSYKSKDPVSELYYAALRYYKNLGNVASYTTLSGAGSSATAVTWLDGFPAITTWDDPIAYSCQKNFILGIGDVNTHRDANLYGSALRSLSSLEPALPSEVSADTSVNVAAATNMVGKLEGISGLGSTFNDSASSACASTSSQCNTYYIAGLAYDAHTKDIRSDLAGVQTVNTYWMDVMESQVYKHKNQYWLAAKYGGFDVPSSFLPYDAGNGTGTIPASAWHTTSDTLARSSFATGELVYSTDTSATTADPRPDNYFPGNQPATMQSGLTQAFAKISSEATAANSTAFSAPSSNVTSSGSVSYAATYDPTSWTGTVIASSVAYAADGTPSLTPKWDARALLSATTVTASTRKIVTCCTTNGASPGLPFTSADLTSTALNARTYYASFSAVPGVSSSSQSAAKFLAYLRGDTKQELANGGAYRTRSFRLGDIVDSKPVAVGAPSAAYYDVFNPGYSGFKSAHASRKTVVYAGANDGMLHAFDGTVDTSSSGGELFAYIPSFVYGDAGTASTSGLASLGQPLFTHHNFVDATPAQFDLDLANTSGATSTSADWRTLLIGGLGKGGKGYYALDVTDPASWSSETAVAGKVLWEFTDPRMGYSYGVPSVVKTKKYGWVVVLTSGYNNSDGIGYFFFVNPRTGDLLEAVATTGGTTSSPVNLAQHTAYVADYTDMTADAIYAGDLQGHVWRLDVTGTGAYTSPTLFATLADADGNAQPVTTRPLVEVEPNSLVRYVLVGTGRLLADTDIASSAVQTFYAIVDGVSTSGGFYTSATLPTGVTFPITRSELNADTNLLVGIGSSPSSAMGWYVDLPVSSGVAQRVNVDPTANSGVVAFIGNLPNGSVCSPTGTGTLYALSLATGQTVLETTTSNGTTSLIASSTPIFGILTDLSILRVNGTLRLYTGGSTGDVVVAPANLSTSSGIKQLNWRDVPLVN